MDCYDYVIMQTERTYNQNSVEPIILFGLRVEKLDTNPTKETIEQLAQIYHSAWKKAGIELTIDKVRSKMNSFDLSETFVVKDNTDIIYASIHTLPVNADNLVQLAKRYKFYNTIEEDSKKAKRRAKVNNPNYRICFSITAVEGVKVKNEGNQIESLAGFLLRRLSAGERKVAFSRFAGMFRASPAKN